MLTILEQDAGLSWIAIGASFVVAGTRFNAPVVATHEAIYCPLIAAPKARVSLAMGGGLIPALIDLWLSRRSPTRSPDLQNTLTCEQLPTGLTAGPAAPFRDLKPCEVLVIPASQTTLTHPKMGNLIYLQTQDRTLCIEYTPLHGEKVRQFLVSAGWSVSWAETWKPPAPAAKDPSDRWVKWALLAVLLVVGGGGLLLSWWPSVDIWNACWNRDHDQVKKHLFLHGDLNRDSLEGKLDYGSPLCIAIERGDLALVELLLNAGADPNKGSGQGGYPPLRWAIRYGQTSIMELLLNRGADPNRRDVLADFMYSGVKGEQQRRLLSILVSHGLKLDTPPGSTALNTALIQMSELDTIRFLVEHGAKPNSETARFRQRVPKDCWDYLISKDPALGDSVH